MLSIFGFEAAAAVCHLRVGRVRHVYWKAGRVDDERKDWAYRRINEGVADIMMDAIEYSMRIECCSPVDLHRPSGECVSIKRFLREGAKGAVANQEGATCRGASSQLPNLFFLEKSGRPKSPLQEKFKSP
jgi:hypothetical protein